MRVKLERNIYNYSDHYYEPIFLYLFTFKAIYYYVTTWGLTSWKQLTLQKGRFFKNQSIKRSNRLA